MKKEQKRERKKQEKQKKRKEVTDQETRSSKKGNLVELEVLPKLVTSLLV